jgi:hypothetical protein
LPASASKSTWDFTGLGGMLFLVSQELALLTVCLSRETSHSSFYTYLNVTVFDGLFCLVFSIALNSPLLLTSIAVL